VKPITEMAFYCCGVRMLDAEREYPVCGDIYAKLFMDDHGRSIYDRFQKQTNSNASIIVRHRIIDDVLRQKLVSNPDLHIVTIGAGFDTRPYRITGGSWIEFDEPDVVAYKNERLPVSGCANSLRRVPIDFSTDSLGQKLSFISCDDPIVVVMEGVFIYLNEGEIKKTLDVFKNLFPTHELICDLVNREMVENYGQELLEKVEEIDANFKAVERPESIFAINGYRVNKMISIVERSIDFGINKIPKFVLKSFFNSIVKGNAIYVFEPHDPYRDLVL
jgi:methyltransferase (TIGR00027 family)